MEFSNNQIQIDNLPNLDAVELKPVSKHYKNIIILNSTLSYTIIFGLLMTGKYTISEPTFQQYFILILVIVVILCLSHLIISLLAFKKLKYAIREHDVIYAKGLLIQSLTTVSISRIQHTETSRSWLARQFQLATLNIYTAGESGSDLSIKGLPQEEAKQVNDFLSEKVNGNN
ncbi:PH domain-containing protein [Psychroserpens sp.]|uniref:PH domain-containing protein n=1 Tax=Psychroserpens sp. TaxID=2020870 RepID=UPI003C76411F